VILAVTDPSATFVDRTTAYVRGNLLLRGLALMTGLNVIGGALLAFVGTLRWDMVGYLVLLSLYVVFCRRRARDEPCGSRADRC